MKTKVYYSLLSILLSISLIYAQGIRNEGSRIGLRGGVIVYIAGNGTGHYTSNSTGIIKVFKTPTTPTVDVYGNWVNNATNTGFYNDSATVRMLVSVGQSIGGTNSTTFYNLILNNSTKTMNVNTSVGGQTQLNGLLDLGNAELNLNQYTITITNPAMTIARTSGYINSENGCGTCNVWSSAVTWSMTTNTGARTIPFGTSAAYLPMAFNKTNAVNSNITVSTRSATASNNTPIPSTVTAMNVPAMSVSQTNDGTNTVIDRWWYITPSTSSSTPVSLDLNFTYRGGENTCTGCPQAGPFGAQYWVEYSATNKGWLPCSAPSWTCSTIGTWPGVTAGTQNASSTTGAVNLPEGGNSTSYWVLSCAAKPLPIELTNFTAICQNNGTAILKWSTASEVNALKFEIQKSTNGIDFTTLGFVNAQYPLGGSYSYTDNTKTSGIAYYRLKMIDKDGSFKFSKIVDTDFNKCNNIRTQIYAYGKDIIAQITSESSQSLRIYVYDALGRILLDKPLEISEGANNFQFPLDVAKSIYFVKLVDNKGNLVQVQKVILSE
ncbi:MAG: hypothetical protein OHK0036_12940 [Bacteroidia bacterium]